MILTTREQSEAIDTRRSILNLFYFKNLWRFL